MFKEKLQMLKNKMQEKSEKKKIENMIFLVIVLVITLIVINIIWSDDDTDNDKRDSAGYKVLAEINEGEEMEDDNIEERLEQILSQMQGVGRVDVMITYSKGSEVIPMQNESSKISTIGETDSEGGIRKIEETDKTTEIIYNSENEVETKTVINPVAKGAIIIAEGATDANVKANIVSAVEAITGLATYKVQVFEMN